MARKNYAKMAAEKEDVLEGLCEACQEITNELQKIMNPIASSEVPLFIFCFENMAKTLRANMRKQDENIVRALEVFLGSQAYSIPHPDPEEE